MVVWVRRDCCYVCNQPVRWNDKTKRLTCGCGEFKVGFVNLREFKREELVVHG
jgi:hypothetical protein